MAAPPPEARTLPSDLLLEIVARTDTATLVRCAACCKHLRQDILSPAFIRRVCDHGAGGAAIVPPRLFGILPSHDTFRVAKSRGIAPPAFFSLAHPATPAAAHFSEMHLAPLLSRGGGNDPQACFYDPITSRNGLVAFKLRNTNNRRNHQKSGICVYDPMAGDRTLVPEPPDMRVPNSLPYYQRYVLLTAVDGIGCSFILLMADFREISELSKCSITVQTVSSDVVAGSRKWIPATRVTCNRSGGSHPHPCSPVVLGGSIHWVMYGGLGRDMMHILTYNIGTATAGRIDLPMDHLPKGYREDMSINVFLAPTSDGRMTLIFNEGLKIWAWAMSADASWAPHAVMDIETPLRSLVPEVPQQLLWPNLHTVFEKSWECSSVLLFSVRMPGHDLPWFFVIDTETKDMRRVDREILWAAIPFKVDLELRLSTMKTF